jgi:outer membrane protein OmpA-like peptidoglycan-associated protein
MSKEKAKKSKVKKTPQEFAFLFSFLFSHSSFARICLTFFIFHFALFICPAQSTADEIETLLSTKAVTYAAAARFLLEASETITTYDPDEAFRYAMARNWMTKKAAANETARLDDVSLLLMRSFGIKGGIMYSIIKNPHYAYRELAYQNIILGRAEPAMNVSGERLLFITLRILNLQSEKADKMEKAPAGIPMSDEEIILLRETLAAEIGAIIEKQQIADVSVEVTDEGVMLRLSNIQFLADSTELAESEKEKLREIADILKTIPDRKIRVAGHTALAGSERGRLVLSRERAQSVASYLILMGARERSQVTVVGYGSDVPIADNATAEGMLANRRVEIIILED